jgi:hypothetical protein
VLCLPTFARNVLRNLAIETIGQLVKAKLEDFAVPNVGPKTLSQIERALWQQGLSIKDLTKRRRHARRLMKDRPPEPKHDVDLVVPFIFAPRTIDRLIFHGQLSSEDRHDPSKIQDALIAFASVMLEARRPWFAHSENRSEAH